LTTPFSTYPKPQNVQSSFSQHLPHIELAMASVLARQYVGSTNNHPVWDMIDRGGKRWRPILFSLLMEFLGAAPRDHYTVAATIEIVHNATLVIDDIEDGSLMRRGRECVHILYGDNVAINAANCVYFVAIPSLIGHRYKVCVCEDFVKLIVLV
jgi:geranylgeranyl pyrophosphate synthase